MKGASGMPGWEKDERKRGQLERAWALFKLYRVIIRGVSQHRQQKI